MLRRHGLRPVRWQYSFHLLGQLWDFWYYYAQERWGGDPGMPTSARPTLPRRLRWRLVGRSFGLLQRLGYWESRLLRARPVALSVDVSLPESAHPQAFRLRKPPTAM